MTMNQFFGTQYSQEDLQQRVAHRRSKQHATVRSATLPLGPSQQQQQQQPNDDAMGMADLIGGDSLDDIIMQNNKELQRRQSFSQPYSTDLDRRASMMEFGAGDGPLSAFQFGTPTSSAGPSHLRRQSAGEVDLALAYPDMGTGINMQMPQMGFSNSMHSNSLTIDTSSQYGNMMPMMGYGALGMEGISQDSPPMNMFSPGSFTPSFANTVDSIPGDFIMQAQDGLPPIQENMTGDSNNHEMMASGPNLTDNDIISSPQNMGMALNIADYHSPANTSNSIPSRASTTGPVAPPDPTSEVLQVPKQEPLPKVEYGDSIYSKSGFDMLGALMRVATRTNPQVKIGAVDMSCAFVVCDLRQHDVPIIYVSDIFERLTGYSKHEVLGQNCRFLQSPTGVIQAGTKRLHTDNSRVHYLKTQIEKREEAQTSVINYRKGGQPFMNLLTMIPIPWEGSGDESVYVVGFQVDIVIKPESITSRDGESGGSYTVNYQQGTLPRYVWQPPEQNRTADAGQTVSRDDVSAVLNCFENGSDPDLTKRMWDKVLLENADDVIHVLSLKGLFLYLSPSCRTVLEYDSSELVGTALSSVCHPSDIVPVTRELKDTSTGVAVNVVFRIRRKNSGYTWFESHGSLCVEQGKGRKCIIMVGRERPVYALARADITTVGGFGENEFWTKLSTSGMFLYVSSSIRALLDRQPEDLIGTSIQALMRPESKVEFGRSLGRARTGIRVTYKHEIQNKRGLTLQAQTTLYPGDASEGQKPTFLVAQTRLLRSGKQATGTSASHSHASNKSIGLGKRSDELMPLVPPAETSPLYTSPESIGQRTSNGGHTTAAGGLGLVIGNQDEALASEDNVFDELKTTRCTSWQFELRQMEKSNRLLAEELSTLLANKKKRKRRKGAGHLQRDCANCHTKNTPEWRRGPSGNRDLCNSCGLRYAKQVSNGSENSSTIRLATRGSPSDTSTSRS